MARLIDVYVYKRIRQSIRVLILKRSPEVIYPGQWRMVGGKVRAGEKAYAAGLRELKEETNLIPKLYWTLPSVNTFYDPAADTVRHIPAFAARADRAATIVLNHEHQEYKWIPETDISAYIQWPEQQRLMHLLVSILTDNQLLDEWIIHDQR